MVCLHQAKRHSGDEMLAAGWSRRNGWIPVRSNSDAMLDSRRDESHQPQKGQQLMQFIHTSLVLLAASGVDVNENEQVPKRLLERVQVGSFAQYNELRDRH